MSALAAAPFFPSKTFYPIMGSVQSSPKTGCPVGDGGRATYQWTLLNGHCVCGALGCGDGRRAHPT